MRRALLFPLIACVMAVAPGAATTRMRQQPAATPSPTGPPLPLLPLQDFVATGIRDALQEARTRHPTDEGWSAVERFYEQRAYRSAWLWGSGRDAARVLIDRMASADIDGLPPARYRPARWPERLAYHDGDLRTALLTDVEFTHTIWRFADDLARGLGHTASQRQIDVVDVLTSIQDPASAVGGFAALEPRHPEYRELRHALREYRRLAGEGGWPSIPEGTFLELDATDRASADGGRAPASSARRESAEERAIRALCERLLITGDLAEPQPGGCGFDEARPRYDTVLERAVRRFQARHGLVVDGIVGPRTLSALNVPAAARAGQIAINMNRWRRLPDDLGEVHIRVNVPAFRMHVKEHGNTVLEMKVVAGEADTPTPVMSDQMTYLEFNPYWNVPASITHGELLPQIVADRGYLRRNQFEIVDGWGPNATVLSPRSIDWSTAQEVFPYRIRQRPGPHNSLGLVKFMFPNEYHVYLHDTPATHRFERRRRAFSHGCVRVEQPVELAQFLLRQNPRWTRDAILSAMHGGQRTVVDLPEMVPVHLTYFTAFVQDDVVQFRMDLYGRDAEELQAIGADRWTTPPVPQ